MRSEITFQKVIHVEECETDDIIGTLCKNTQEFGQYEDTIVSADKDFYNCRDTITCVSTHLY